MSNPKLKNSITLPWMTICTMISDLKTEDIEHVRDWCNFILTSRKKETQ